VFQRRATYAVLSFTAVTSYVRLVHKNSLLLWAGLQTDKAYQLHATCAKCFVALPCVHQVQLFLLVPWFAAGFMNTTVILREWDLHTLSIKFKFCNETLESLSGSIFWVMTPCSLHMNLLARLFLARLIFYPENGGNTFLRNVGSHTDYAALYRKRYNYCCENLKPT
jgi:hypothetical protein